MYCSRGAPAQVRQPVVASVSIDVLAAVEPRTPLALLEGEQHQGADGDLASTTRGAVIQGAGDCVAARLCSGLQCSAARAHDAAVLAGVVPGVRLGARAPAGLLDHLRARKQLSAGRMPVRTAVQAPSERMQLPCTWAKQLRAGTLGARLHHLRLFRTTRRGRHLQRSTCSQHIHTKAASADRTSAPGATKCAPRCARAPWPRPSRRLRTWRATWPPARTVSTPALAQRRHLCSASGSDAAYKVIRGQSSSGEPG